jgi:hypothetical protein
VDLCVHSTFCINTIILNSFSSDLEKPFSHPVASIHTHLTFTYTHLLHKHTHIIHPPETHVQNIYTHHMHTYHTHTTHKLYHTHTHTHTHAHRYHSTHTHTQFQIVVHTHKDRIIFLHGSMQGSQVY